MEQKTGGFSHVANTEVWVTGNLANTKSRVTENSANMESWATKNSTNMESQVTENLIDIENRVIQDSGGKKPEEGRGVAPSKRLAPRWCLRGITKTQKRRMQKMHQRELAEKKKEEERDYLFNRLWPMTKTKQTWQEKWLAKEEGGSSGNSSEQEASRVTLARAEDNLGSGDGNLELGNCNPESGNYHQESGNRNSDSGNSNPGKESDRQGEELILMDVNVLFTCCVQEAEKSGCAHEASLHPGTPRWNANRTHAH
jgi:hypothetical protein